MLCSSVGDDSVDSLVPIAYAIITETHWHHPDINYGGVELVLKISQMSAHILGGGELVKSVGKACAKCRIMHKRRVRVATASIMPP